MFSLTALTSLLLLNYIAKRFGDLVGKGLGWRVIGEFFMLPVLTVVANATAIVSAWLTLITATTATTNDYVTGLRLSFASFQVIYSLIKAVCFGGAIAIVCSYEGYVTAAGAEGVGRSTAKAVVIASTSILVLDAIVAAVFAKFIAA